MVPSYAALASRQTPCTVSSTGDAGVGEAGGRWGGGESAQAGEWLYSHKRVDGVQETMCMVFGVHKGRGGPEVPCLKPFLCNPLMQTAARIGSSCPTVTRPSSRQITRP